jgi:uncharacterized protein
MRYLIDGHNLIPKIRSLSLQDIDDEEKLIAYLNRFSTKARAQVEVYFDKAPIDSARSVKIGAVRVHFIRMGSSADAAMIERVQKMGTSTQGVTVVSSDHAIQNVAKRMKLKLISSDEFSGLIEDKLARQEVSVDNGTRLSDDEISEWLRLFGNEKT